MTMAGEDDRIFLLSRRWRHHSNHSGYDLLGRHIGQTLNANPISNTLVPDRIFWRMTKRMRGYDRTGLALELLAARHMATRHGCLYHVIYGETCYNYLGYLNGWRGHRVIASYHHPPYKFADLVRGTEQIQRLSAVVIVGRNQYPYFENILPSERIFYVSHPIDTSYFIPVGDFSHRDEGLCLFVGAHLRDLATLRLVIEDARILAPQLSFAVVSHPKHVAELENIVGNLTLHSGLEEEELLRLYQKATLFIQPLIDATANNSIMEALSCGLPMVVTDIGGVREYINENCACFVPPYDPEAMLETILGLVNDRKRREFMSMSAREQALRFDWHVVAGQMQEVYGQILGRD